MKEKKSKADCKSCPLYNQHRVLADTNCKDVRDAEIVILAEAPASEEIKQNKPLVGKAGKIFRKAFEISELDKEKYFISNVVLCSNIQDNKTINPPQEAIDLCKANWQNFIEIIKPKIIILLGSIPLNIFKITDLSVTKAQGNTFDYNGIDVVVNTHPSYVSRKGGLDSDEGKKFIDVFKNVKSRFIKKDVILEDNIEDDIIINSDDGNIHSFKLPSWCYSEDMCKIDIQHIKEKNTILYIFRNKDGEKIFHKTSASPYYFYVTNGDLLNSPMLELESNVNIAKESKHSLKKYVNQTVYEGDIRTELKHSIDYYYNRKTPEIELDLKVLFFDIEIYSEGDRTFPDPKIAPKPINAISFKMDSNKTYLFLLKSKNMDKSQIIFNREDVVIKLFDTEKDLLKNFANAVRKINPDIIAGWNSNYFDIPTIYNRCLKNKVNPNLFSPVGLIHVNPLYPRETNFYGMYSLDMLDLYKELSTSVEESYSLENISQKHLGRGKIEHKESLDGLYESNINKFIEYSITDTDLLYDLNKKLGHIDLKFELIRICSSSWKASESTTGLVDPLCIGYAKNKNLVCKNAIRKGTEQEYNIPGAYVKSPKSGLYSYIVDLDFSSLYPSIIRSCNIGPNTYIARIRDDVENRLYYDKKNKTEENYFNKIAFNYTYKNYEDIPDKIYLELNPMNRNHETVEMSLDEFSKFLSDNDAILTCVGTIFKGHKKEKSFFNDILEFLLNSRKKYKKMLGEATEEKNEKLRQKYECIQYSYKILANSLYGVLANSAFRFYNTDMGKTITLTGQELVKFSGYHLGTYLKTNNKKIDKDFIYDYDKKDISYIIYQDTDSIFLDIHQYLIDKGKISWTT